MKMGRFDDSIVQYRKALAIDPHFVPSHFGLVGDLMYKDQPDQAMAELQNMADIARNDGELRTAYFGMAVVASDRGQFDKAIAGDGQRIRHGREEKRRRFDGGRSAGQGQHPAALRRSMTTRARQFDHSLQLIEGSTLSQEIKDNARLQHHFNMGALAIAKKDYAAAKTHADAYRQGAEASQWQPAYQAFPRAGRTDRTGTEGLRQGDRGTAAGQPAGSVEPLPAEPGLQSERRLDPGA